MYNKLNKIDRYGLYGWVKSFLSSQQRIYVCNKSFFLSVSYINTLRLYAGIYKRKATLSAAATLLFKSETLKGARLL